MRTTGYNFKFFCKLLAPLGRSLFGTITHVKTRDSIVALTFDDGPHPKYTPLLLDILDKHQARGTFFMIGESAQRYPDIVQQVANAGHAIGNHSWDHPSFPLITAHERRAQIHACKRAIAPYGQRLFRPPYGDQSIASRLEALWFGYQVITWNLHADDWLDHDAEWMAKRLASKIQPGDIILLHDTLWRPVVKTAADRSKMLEAVKMILEQFDGRFRFVTVPELLRQGQPQRQNWYKKPDLDWLKLKEQCNEVLYMEPTIEVDVTKTGL